MTDISYTTREEDDRFTMQCRVRKYTLEEAMHYFRKNNSKNFRRQIIETDVPAYLKEMVFNQCRLEGLI